MDTSSLIATHLFGQVYKVFELVYPDAEQRALELKNFIRSAFDVAITETAQENSELADKLATLQQAIQEEHPNIKESLRQLFDEKAALSILEKMESITDEFIAEVLPSLTPEQQAAVKAITRD